MGVQYGLLNLMEIHHTNGILPIVFARPARNPLACERYFPTRPTALSSLSARPDRRQTGGFTFVSISRVRKTRRHRVSLSTKYPLQHIYIRSAFDIVFVTVSDGRAKDPVRDIVRAVQMSHPPVTIGCCVSFFSVFPRPVSEHRPVVEGPIQKWTRSRVQQGAVVLEVTYCIRLLAARSFYNFYRN